MKIVCVNDKYNTRNNLSIGITNGKIYDVVIEDDLVYFIKNDKSRIEQYIKHRFITLDEYRTQRINKILKL